MTKDGLLLQGIYSEPTIKKHRAVLWMHGLSSAFYHEVRLTRLLVEALENKGWGFAHFNSRGHDVLAGIRKKTAPRHMVIHIIKPVPGQKYLKKVY